jgi:site-specific DNA-methyltransferase (adenine-specific)
MKPYYSDDAVTIYHGDCREVLPTLEPESVTMLWTDPPYGHDNANGDWLSRRHEIMGDGKATTHVAIANDSPELMREVVDAMLTLVVPLLRPDCCCCCCCVGGGGPTPSFAWLAERMARNGLAFFHSIIWDKRNPGVGWRYRRQHEMIMVSHRSGGRLAWNPDAEPVGNIVSAFPPRQRLHPNEKPSALVAGFVGRHTLPGELILDPFMGSGVVLEVAKAMGRRAIGIEIDEKYCKVAVDRVRGTRTLVDGSSQESLWEPVA